MDFSVKLEGLDRLASKSRIVSQIAQQELKKALLASAQMVEKSAKESIAEGGKTGRIYKRGGVTHQASAPGEAPATDRGALVSRGINIRPAYDEAAIDVVAGTADIKYARALEFGTRNMEARPFLFPALEQNRAKIAARLEAALDKTIDRAAQKGFDSLG